MMPVSNPETNTTSITNDICFPRCPTTGEYDLSFPCNIAYYIMLECTYGPSHTLHYLHSEPQGPKLPHSKAAHDIRAQQLCACGSRMGEYWIGCADCFAAHGDPVINLARVLPVARAYCAVGSRPTAGVMEVVEQAVRGMLPVHERPAMGPDPLSGSTGVGLYFTPLGTRYRLHSRVARWR